MTKRETNLLKQLLEARNTIQRQIEILEVGPVIDAWGGGTDFDSAKAELEATLKEIEGSLARLKADDAES
jgi:hypothetical protein